MTTTIQLKTLDHALRMLNAAGAKYVVVFDGVTHATEGMRLEVPREEPARRTRKINTLLPHGAVLNYARPVIDTMLVGDVVELPTFENCSLEILRSSIVSHCCRKRGNGSVNTTINKATNMVEVLRVL